MRRKLIFGHFNFGLAHQLQTSKFELDRAQTDVSHLRSLVERNQSTENRDAEDLQFF